MTKNTEVMELKELPEGQLKEIEGSVGGLVTTIQKDVALTVANYSKELERYKNRVVTLDTIPSDKRDRATLGNALKALKAQKQRIKNCFNPNEIMATFDQVVAEITETRENIDLQIKNFESEKKQKALDEYLARSGDYLKRYDLEEYFDEIPQIEKINLSDTASSLFESVRHIFEGWKNAKESLAKKQEVIAGVYEKIAQYIEENSLQGYSNLIPKPEIERVSEIDTIDSFFSQMMPSLENALHHKKENERVAREKAERELSENGKREIIENFYSRAMEITQGVKLQLPDYDISMVGDGETAEEFFDRNQIHIDTALKNLEEEKIQPTPEDTQVEEVFTKEEHAEVEEINQAVSNELEEIEKQGAGIYKVSFHFFIEGTVEEIEGITSAMRKSCLAPYNFANARGIYHDKKGGFSIEEVKNASNNS